MRKILLFVLGLLIITFYSCKKSSVTNAPENNTTIGKTVNIGSQVWSAENLNVDHYRNGDPIPQVQDKNEWSNLKTGAWCYYDNKSENGEKYGKLYNWFAIYKQNTCFYLILKQKNLQNRKISKVFRAGNGTSRPVGTTC